VKTLILFNRHAAGGHSERSVERILARAYDVDVVTPTTRDDVELVARQILADRVDLLGVVGGDGTIHTVLSALERARDLGPMPTIALLGGGTLNTIASSVGARRRSLGSAIDRFRAIRSEESIPTTERATMKCNGAIGSLFGVGVVETFLREYYATGTPDAIVATRILGTAAIESVIGGPMFRAFTAREPFALTLDEGEAFEMQPTLSIAAGTVADLGLGFRPFHRITTNPGTIHLVRYHGDAASLARSLPRIRFARPLRPEVADDRTTRGFTIRAGAAPIRYMIDGDLYEHEGTDLRVDLGPTIRYATLA